MAAKLIIPDYKTPREHQQHCIDTGIETAKKSIVKQVQVVPTGGGKALIGAEFSKAMHQLSGGKTAFLLAPSRRLVLQNYLTCLGQKANASVYCAGLSMKNLTGGIVCASPQSLVGAIDKLSYPISLTIDEGDLITPTVKKIYQAMHSMNPYVRVLSLTASPHRLKTGFIYKAHYLSGMMTEEQTTDAWYDLCTAEVDPDILIRLGYILDPVIGDTRLAYDTSKLIAAKTPTDEAEYTHESMLDTFVNGQECLTRQIVAEVLVKTESAKGIMWFCSTTEHCFLVASLLPENDTVCIAGKIGSKEREKMEEDFADGKVRHMVSLQTQTVGCDYPHADVCVLLRRSESKRLLQQIIGRVLRSAPGKLFATVLDFAGNMSTHFPRGNIFKPEISVVKSDYVSEKGAIDCPLCGYQQDASINQKLLKQAFTDWETGVDEFGYIHQRDYSGNPLPFNIEEKYRFTPAHFSRRCRGIVTKKESIEQCTYRWTYKICVNEECLAENDIAAKKCDQCGSQLVDPNDKLKIDSDLLTLVEPIASANISGEIGNGMCKLTIRTVTGQLAYGVFHLNSNIVKYATYQGSDKLRIATYRHADKGDFFSIRNVELTTW